MKITVPPVNAGFDCPVSTDATLVGREHPLGMRTQVKGGLALPGYKILRIVGRGGMATVSKARQLSPKRLVAVKVLDASLAGDGDTVPRFRQEHALGARLAHPNLVAAYHAGLAAGSPFLVMEFVRGDNLDELVRRHGPLPVAEACEVIRQAALGLQHLHDHGLVHRDVEPSNLMLTPAGRVKLLDLGLARHLHGRPSGGGSPRPASSWAPSTTWPPSSAWTVTPSMAAPTSTRWAARCTNCWPGSPPFASPAYESLFLKMKAHVEAPVLPIRGRRLDVPRRLAVALGRMLAKDRERRFASPAAVVAAVQPFAAGADLGGLSCAFRHGAVPAA